MTASKIKPRFRAVSMSVVGRNNAVSASSLARSHLATTLIAVAREDKDAFKELYRLTSVKLFGICLRICGDHESAEDVLHEVYLIIWRRAGSWQPGIASPISWLAVIARNRSIDWRRAQGARPTSSIEEASKIFDSRPNPEIALIANDESRRLIKCLQKLDVRSRTAICTAFLDGLSYAEVADSAGVPVNTVKSWIRRGLRQLQICLSVNHI